MEKLESTINNINLLLHSDNENERKVGTLLLIFLSISLSYAFTRFYLEKLEERKKNKICNTL